MRRLSGFLLTLEAQLQVSGPGGCFTSLRTLQITEGICQFTSYIFFPASWGKREHKGMIKIVIENAAPGTELCGARPGMYRISLVGYAPKFSPFPAYEEQP